MTVSKTSSLLPTWVQHEHPVYDLEVRRRIENRALTILRLGCVPAILATASLALSVILAAAVISQASWLYDWYSLDSMNTTLLGWAVATIMIIQLGAGAMVNILVIAQTSPTISGEVELQSWGLLRTTMLPLKEIVLAKYAAALRQLRAPLFALMILRAASTITILLFAASTTLRGTLYYMDASQWSRFWREILWLPPLIAFVVALIWYFLQPIVQLLLNGAIGMMASAYASTRAQAIAAGLVGRLAAWVAVGTLHLGIGLGLIFLNSQWASGQYSSIAAFNTASSPSELATTWITCIMYGGYVLSFFLVQLAAIAILLGLVLRRARKLGA
jgi:hypothetical protein